MEILYTVPPELEARLSKLSEAEICRQITRALYSSDIEMVQNMCLDILLKLSSIENNTAKIDTIQEMLKTRPVQYIQEQPIQTNQAPVETAQVEEPPKQEPPKKRRDLSKTVKNKNKRRFAASLLK